MCAFSLPSRPCSLYRADYPSFPPEWHSELAACSGQTVVSNHLSTSPERRTSAASSSKFACFIPMAKIRSTNFSLFWGVHSPLPLWREETAVETPRFLEVYGGGGRSDLASTGLFDPCSDKDDKRRLDMLSESGRNRIKRQLVFWPKM